LQSNSGTMQARRPLVTRMLTFGAVYRAEAANNSAVHGPSRTGAAFFKRLGNSNIASLARPSNYAPTTTWARGRI
jgi:hypothetical protein